MELVIVGIVVAILLLTLLVGLVARARGRRPIPDAQTADVLERAAEDQRPVGVETLPRPPPEAEPEAEPVVEERPPDVAETETVEPPLAEPETEPEAEVVVTAQPEPVIIVIEEPPGAEPEPEAEPEPVQAVVIEEPPGAELEPEVVAEARLSVAERFRQRLGRARIGLGATVTSIFRRGVDEEAWEELEESLIAADVGVEATLELVEGLRDRAKAEGVRTGEQALALLKEVLRLELSVEDRRLRRRDSGTSVWLFTGVNGTGKTTSIGKLAARHRLAGEQVVLAAADTFRAAAAEQLELWGERAGARVVRGQQGADPAAVAFDGYASAKASAADILMVDTAGRLQNKRALMEELSKVKRVLERDAGPCDEVLLVLDATTGQNGLVQAKAFLDAVEVSGVVLTKLDSTAKGGIVIAIQRQLGIPVKLVGLGESIDDLADFDPDAFVEALFANENEQDNGQED
jgi:fused signal recognition particle receptor